VVGIGEQNRDADACAHQAIMCFSHTRLRGSSEVAVEVAEDPAAAAHEGITFGL
jgi:hypothetical protein